VVVDMMKLCRSCVSHSRCLDHMCVDAVAPTMKPTILTIPASGIIRLILRTPMTVNAFGIGTIHLIIAGRHSCNLAQDTAFSFGQGIGMRMGAVVRCAIGRALKIVDVAQLQFLDPLDFMIGNGRIDLVDPLAVPVPFDPLAGGFGDDNFGALHRSGGRRSRSARFRGGG